MSKLQSCPRCGGERLWRVRQGKCRCAACRYEWTPRALPLHLSGAEWRRLLRWFVLDMSVAVIAEESGLGRGRVLRALRVVREVLASDTPPLFAGRVEVDETYIGGKYANRRAKNRQQPSPRGRGCMKQAVFGILCRGGAVWAEVVPDVRAQTLMPLLRRRVTVGSEVHSDQFRSYTGVAGAGYVHRIVNHSETFSDGRGVHINGLEGFWGYLKRRLPARGGIRAERLPLYLGEYVWRFNHRKMPRKQQVNRILELLREGQLGGLSGT